MVADTNRAENGMKMTPAMGILMAVVVGLVLVAVCIILVMRVQHAVVVGLVLLAVCIILVMRVQHANMRGLGSYKGNYLPLQQHSQGTCFEHQPEIIPRKKGDNLTVVFATLFSGIFPDN